MKKIMSLLAMLFVLSTTQAQNPFFEVVNYRGAFAPAPASPWTTGWTNFDPQNTVYPAATDTVSGNITVNTTWTTGKTYLLRGLVYVKNGAILTIQPGVVVRGDASVAQTALVITKGSKINAVGTSSSPIVFTSSKDTGRAVGDWGGVIMLGKASLNKAGGVADIEGIASNPDIQYGGGTTPDDNDNSGNLKYVRIEFGGYIFASNQEINGLTMGAVGRNTIIDFVQTSFINDDAFEWFGGTVNCSHLVAFRSVDDDFDTDFGYSGSVQFALGVRDPNLSDQAGESEGFESDNDGQGTSNTPITSPVFSNVTWIGPFRGTVDTSSNPLPTFKFRRALRIRRNSRLKVLNSIFTDTRAGVFIDGTSNRNNLQTGNGVFKNNIIAGCRRAVETGTTAGLTDSLFNNAQFNNDSLVSTTGLLESPYDFVNGDYRPATGSPALADVNFADAAFNGRKIIITADSKIREVSYRGAFAPSPVAMWTEGWCEWNPQSRIYPAVTDTIAANITTNTTWTSDKTYLLNGIIYVNSGVTLTIQPGTVIRGNALVSGGTALIISRNAKIIAQGTAEAPIVFTSSKDTGARVTGDWGGLIILGRAAINRAGGVANIEGVAPAIANEYGGGATPNDNDNSGIVSYVRIEYGGYIFTTDKEINGLTMGGVGRATQIDHVQVSFINDDAFEWFGGTVSCSYLVAYRCVDDNWDADFGYSGSVQFALGVRDPNLSDQAGESEGFETDNDGTGSTNTPFTKGLFTNVTEIGPYRGVKATSTPTGTFKFRRAARIRRNSRLKIFNSIFTDYPYGVFIDGASNRVNLQTGNGKFKNNLIAGMFRATEPGTATTLVDSIFNSSFWKNDSLATTANVLTTPYNYFAPDYRPGSNPLSTTGAAFTDSVFNGLIIPCDEVNSPSAITGSSNIAGCTNPQTYSILAIANASAYFWTVPTGATIVSGQGTRTITVNFASTLTATFTGTITVVGKNDCGNTSASSTLSLTKVALGVPGTISAPLAFAANVCSLVGKDTAITFTIPAVAGATNYAWTAPSNATIMTGQGTNTITVKFLNGYTTAIAGDTLRVVVSSSCSTAVAKKFAIKAALPSAPTAITIAPIQTNVCAARRYRYSVPVSTASGFTGYSWSFQGPLYSTMTIDSGSVTSRVFTAIFTSNSAATSADSVKCFYTSSCGNSLPKGAKLSNTALAAPAAPTAITIVSVAQNVCNARQYRYSAPNLPLASTTAGAATAWNWELVGSLAEFANIDSGEVNGQKILVTFSSNAASATGDSIKLFYSSNGCGDSKVKASKMSNTKLNVPAAPSAITITAIQTNVCGARRYRYSAPALPAASTTAGAATGYVWNFVGTKIPTVDSGDANSRTFTAIFTSNDAAATGDSVKVFYTSVCGNSLTKASKLSNLALGKPLAPATLTIQQVLPDICGARKYRYIAPVTLPVATTTVGAATGYLWTAPFGTLGSTGTIDSGDVNSANITVTYTSNAAAAAGDSIKLQFTSVCGNGAFKASKLSNVAKLGCLTSGTPITSRVEATSTKAQVYPNPNNGNFTLNVATGVTAKASATVQIVDMLGKVVMTTLVTNNNGSIVANIENSNLQNGVYTVKYTVGNVTNSIKMVVKK